MHGNGNRSKAYLDENCINSIVLALEDSRYDWRSVDGVSEQTGIPATQVREALENQMPEIVRSSVPDELGRALYTTRKHYRQTHGIGARFLDAVAGKIA